MYQTTFDDTDEFTAAYSLTLTLTYSVWAMSYSTTMAPACHTLLHRSSYGYPTAPFNVGPNFVLFNGVKCGAQGCWDSIPAIVLICALRIKSPGSSRLREEVRNECWETVTNEKPSATRSRSPPAAVSRTENRFDRFSGSGAGL